MKFLKSFKWIGWAIIIASIIVYIWSLGTLLFINETPKKLHNFVLSKINKDTAVRDIYEAVVNSERVTTNVEPFLQYGTEKEKKNLKEALEQLKRFSEKHHLKNRVIVEFKWSLIGNEKIAGSIHLVEWLEFEDNIFVRRRCNFIKFRNTQEWQIAALEAKSFTSDPFLRYQVNFHEASIKQLGMLFLLILTPLIVLTTATLCLQSNVKFKGLWFLFILFGLGNCSFNYSTQMMEFNYLMISFLSASFWKGSTQPLEISLGLPLGALLFLGMFLVKKLKNIRFFTSRSHRASLQNGILGS